MLSVKKKKKNSVPVNKHYTEDFPLKATGLSLGHPLPILPFFFLKLVYLELD